MSHNGLKTNDAAHKTRPHTNNNKLHLQRGTCSRRLHYRIDIQSFAASCRTISLADPLRDFDSSDEDGAIKTDCIASNIRVADNRRLAKKNCLQ